MPSYFWAFAECFPTWQVWVVGDLIFRAGHALVRANTLQSNNRKVNQQIKARSRHLHISFLAGRQVCCRTSCWHRNQQYNILKYAKIYTLEKKTQYIPQGKVTAVSEGKAKPQSKVETSERRERKKIPDQQLGIRARSWASNTWDKGRWETSN